MKTTKNYEDGTYTDGSSMVTIKDDKVVRLSCLRSDVDGYSPDPSDWLNEPTEDEREEYERLLAQATVQLRNQFTLLEPYDWDDDDCDDDCDDDD